MKEIDPFESQFSNESDGIELLRQLRSLDLADKIRGLFVRFHKWEGIDCYIGTGKDLTEILSHIFYHSVTNGMTKEEWKNYILGQGKDPNYIDPKKFMMKWGMLWDTKSGIRSISFCEMTPDHEKASEETFFQFVGTHGGKGNPPSEIIKEISKITENALKIFPAFKEEI